MSGAGEAVSAARLEGMLDTALAKLEAMQRARSEPIAVVGLACRFPGAPDPAAYWRLLRDGVDAVTEVPPDRWDLDALYDPDPEAEGRLYVRRGGFLAQVDGFDARFFEISPREAASMDPQQRLLLEVAWEAMEDAGIPPATLAGSATGVFLGATTNDYGSLVLREGAAALDAYFSTGNALNASAGRIAHVLGLQGPCMALDTACSSSLVAVHLACQSLRAGECDAALAGGVNLMLAPEVTIAICRARMLAPDGRCKTFDAAADGYVRGEGCGAILLKRRSDALAAGDRVLAWIRGSAVNQDGATSGFTVPNGRAQQALIRRALAAARVAPAEIDYLEAHGTGTALGDPIELRAAAAVLGEGRVTDRPLLVGSAKTNIGHLEAAAGIAGLIKAVLALRHGTIPPHLHFRTPSPHIPWAELPVEVATEARPWPGRDRPHLAAVSSFGASGTNAHLILEEAPQPGVAASDRRPRLLALSARTGPALRQLAGRYADHLAAHPDLPWADVCATADAGRAHFPCRAALVAAEAAEAVPQLRALARGGEDRAAPAAGRSPRVAFLFTGQGAHYVGMGRHLYAAEPRFRQSLNRADAVLRGLLDRPLAELLFAPDTAWLRHTAFAQPALFALECALAELWQSWGIRPAAVMGHSLGEYTAACVAGVFTPEDGLRLVARRAQLMGALLAGGAMAAVAAAEDVVALALGPDVAIAAANAPAQTVISGAAGAVEAVLARLAAAGIAATPLRVSHAFHSPLLEPMLDDLGAAAARIRFGRPQLPLISNLTGAPAAEEVATPDYWVRHARQPVRFAAGMAALRARGCDAFLEIGPGRTLLALGQLCLPDAEALWLASLQPGGDEAEVMLRSLGRLYERGAAIDWPAVGRGHGRVALPTYPWQRERHWRPSAPAVARGPEAALPDAELLYEVAWRPRPAVPWGADAGFWPKPSEQAGPLQELLCRLAPEHADAAYCEALLRLEALSLRYVAAAWERLGWRFEVGPRCRATELAARLGVADRHRRLLHRLAEMLAEGGLLRREGEDWIGVAPFPGAPDGREVELLLARAPAAVAECTLLDRCGRRLAAVLRGEQEALPLLFPEGEAIAASSLYRDAPGARLMNRVLAEAVARALRHLPAGRMLRVLEVGAGSGATTEALLQHLPPDRTEYLFTDISARFTTAAEARFEGHGALRARIFDLERDPAAQGFAENARFDLIIAANVLHATQDLRRSLRHLQRLAAPSAMLLLLESTAPIRAVDLVFGLTDGWWRFEDDRTGAAYPLIPAEAWTALLAECGFGEAAALRLPDEPWGLLARQAVILARATEVPAVRPLAGRQLLILADRGSIGCGLAARYAAGGGVATLIDAADPEAVSPAQLRRCLAGLDPTLPMEVVQLGGLEEAGPERLGLLACGGALDLVQALTAEGPKPPLSRTWLVTRGAIGPGPLPGLAQAGLWGLGRAAAQEHPELRPIRLDLDPAAPAEDCVRALWDELCTDPIEDELRVRAGTRQVSRLLRCAEPAPTAALRFSRDACYLVTGGLGGLGLLTARWLAERGAGTLMLVGRRPAGEAAVAECRALEAMGARVLPWQADIAEPAEVERLLRHIQAALPPLRGVVHAAGVLEDGMLRQLDRDRLARVLRPKLAGAWNLHRATAGTELDFFVLYSSFAGILGTPGQANHAAANAFLDALAWHRHATGLPALSLDWGAWSEIGAAARQNVGERLAAHGGAAIAPEQGLRLLERCWGSVTPQRAIVPIRWQQVEAARLRRPLLAEFLPAASAVADAAPGLRARLRAASPRRRRAMLVDHVAAEAAKVLGLKAGEAIDPAQGFFELGMDSLTSVELRNRLRAGLGCELPTTLAFDHPTPEALAEFLLGQFGDPAEPQQAPRTHDGPDLESMSVAELDLLIDQLAGPA